jgi:hypothetical protein
MGAEIEYEMKRSDGRQRTFKAVWAFGRWWSWHGVTRTASAMIRLWERKFLQPGETPLDWGEPMTAHFKARDQEGPFEVDVPGVTLDQVAETVERVSDERDARTRRERREQRERRVG